MSKDLGWTSVLLASCYEQKTRFCQTSGTSHRSIRLEAIALRNKVSFMFFKLQGLHKSICDARALTCIEPVQAFSLRRLCTVFASKGSLGFNYPLQLSKQTLLWPCLLRPYSCVLCPFFHSLFLSTLSSFVLSLFSLLFFPAALTLPLSMISYHCSSLASDVVGLNLLNNAHTIQCVEESLLGWRPSLLVWRPHIVFQHVPLSTPHWSFSHLCYCFFTSPYSILART